MFSQIVEGIASQSKKVRAEIYPVLIDAFEEFDCDTLSECAGLDPVLDVVMAERGYIGEDDDD